jgi:serine protease AprX
MRDIFWKGGNVIAPSSTTNFGVSEVVTRTELAKALVKALGLDALAQQNMNTKTTFIDDASIPADARGYVVVAEQQGLLDGYLNSDNKTYSFKPSEHVTRGAFAYSLLKGYHVFMK